MFTNWDPIKSHPQIPLIDQKILGWEHFDENQCLTATGANSAGRPKSVLGFAAPEKNGGKALGVLCGGKLCWKSQRLGISLDFGNCSSLGCLLETLGKPTFGYPQSVVTSISPNLVWVETLINIRIAGEFGCRPPQNHMENRRVWIPKLQLDERFRPDLQSSSEFGLYDQQIPIEHGETIPLRETGRWATKHVVHHSNKHWVYHTTSGKLCINQSIPSSPTVDPLKNPEPN